MINIYCSGFKFRPVVRDNLLSNDRVAGKESPLLSGAIYG
jgi:hypothetical protein